MADGDITVDVRAEGVEEAVEEFDDAEADVTTQTPDVEADGADAPSMDAPDTDGQMDVSGVGREVSGNGDDTTEVDVEAPETDDDGGDPDLGEALGAGIIGGLVAQLGGPLLDAINPIVTILQAFLAPMAVIFLRLMQPVLRILIKILPFWMKFMEIVGDVLVGTYAFLLNLPMNLWSLLKQLPQMIWDFTVALPGLIWSFFTGAFDILTRALGTIPADIWDFVKALPENIWNLMSALPQLIWDLVVGGFNTIDRTLGDLPRKIWDFVKALPRMIWDLVSGLSGDIADAIAGIIPDAPGLSDVPGGGSLRGAGEALFGSGNPFGAEGDTPVNTRVSIGGGLAPFVDTIERDGDIELS